MGNRRKVRIKPYTWDRGRPNAIEGFMLDDHRAQIFLSEDDAVNLSDAIIDLIESKENLMFITKPENYQHNMDHSRTITASPAKLTTPDGEHISAVGIWTRGMVSSIVTADAAHRLALEIVTALEAHKKKKPVHRPTETNDHFAELADR